MDLDSINFDWMLEHLYLTVIVLWAIISVLSRKPGFALVFFALPLMGIIYLVQRPALPIVAASMNPQSINSDPVQTMLPRPIQFEYHQQHHLIALATYVITARVLSVRPYPGEASPVDLALGWGIMADKNTLSQIVFSQADRFYQYSSPNSGPLPFLPQQIVTNTSNNHILPASLSVESAIDDLRKGQVISLGGYLVNIEDPRGVHLKTSLKRDDTGGECSEVFYVQSIKIF